MASLSPSRWAAITLACLLQAAAFSACTKEAMDAYPDSWVGVGVELRMEPAGARVVRVIRGGPAAAAGLAPDQVILEVEGRSLRGKKLSEVVAMLRGEPQTEVKLVVHTDSGEKPFTLTRKAIVASR